MSRRWAAAPWTKGPVTHVVIGLALLGAVTVLGTSLAGQTRPAVDSFQLFEIYEREGRVGPLAFADVGQFVSMLNRAGPAWIMGALPAQREHRRHVLAVLALETAAVTVSPSEIERRDGMAIIEWACRLLREERQTEFEHRWMLASNAVFPRTDLERMGRPADDLTAHLRHALIRFSADARLRLLRLFEERPESVALVSRPGADPNGLVRATGHGTVRGGPKGTDRIGETLRLLQDIGEDPGAGAEARAHAGLLEFHLRELPRSLADLRSAAEGTTDPFIQNLAWLGVGLVMDAQGRQHDATEAYRAAVQAVPRARASAVALAAHLVLEGQHAEASVVLDRAYGADQPALDPWRHIVAPERSFTNDLADLRRLANLPVQSRLDPPAVVRAPLPTGLDQRTSPGGLSAARQDLPTVGPVFRSTASGVTLDVAVTAGHVPVLDLTAQDFEVLDNGVAQAITVSSVETVPIDVSLVVSFFVKGGARNQNGSTQSLGLLEPAVKSTREIAGLLLPTDRLRLIEADGAGAERWSLQTSTGHLPTGALPVDRFPNGRKIGGAATYGRLDGLYDAVGAALFRPAPLDRRHVVIVFSDGEDSASVLTPQLLLNAARQAGPVMYLIRRSNLKEKLAEIMMADPRSLEAGIWRSDPRDIEAVATATGGAQYYDPHGDMVVDFKRILDQFRRSYVVRYQPTGVPNTGWHDIKVRITRPGRYEVHARDGYSGG